MTYCSIAQKSFKIYRNLSNILNGNYNKVNGWVFLDKPSGKSSNYVLQKIKKQFNINKLGFVGTLDPLASGFLPIAFGKATKTTSLPRPSHSNTNLLLTRACRSRSVGAGGKVMKPKPLDARPLPGQSGLIQNRRSLWFSALS